MVSAFLVQEGLTLAQDPCEAKSNEITAIPRLLARLVLEGAVVTIDAAGCQRAIMQDLRAAGADYVLAVKRNQRTLHAAVRTPPSRTRNGMSSGRRCKTTARPSSATAVAASGVPARCWAAPVSARGWRTPQSGPACTA